MLKITDASIASSLLLNVRVGGRNPSQVCGTARLYSSCRIISDHLIAAVETLFHVLGLDVEPARLMQATRAGRSI